MYTSDSDTPLPGHLKQTIGGQSVRSINESFSQSVSQFKQSISQSVKWVGQSVSSVSRSSRSVNQSVSPSHCFIIRPVCRKIHILNLFTLCFLAPDGPRLKFSSVSFSPAPRGLLFSETKVSPNIPREGPVEIPNTEELYTALSLRTDKSQIINEFNE